MIDTLEPVTGFRTLSQLNCHLAPIPVVNGYLTTPVIDTIRSILRSYKESYVIQKLFIIESYFT